MKEKSQVEDIDRSLYDFRNEEKANIYKVEEGLTPEMMKHPKKNDPAWMQLFTSGLSDLQFYESAGLGSLH